MKSIRREDPAAERQTEKHERQHDWVGFSWVDVTNLQEHFDFWIIKIRDGIWDMIIDISGITIIILQTW